MSYYKRWFLQIFFNNLMFTSAFLVCGISFWYLHGLCRLLIYTMSQKGTSILLHITLADINQF